jgi:hypothetical protein
MLKTKQKKTSKKFGSTRTVKARGTPRPVLDRRGQEVKGRVGCLSLKFAEEQKLTKLDREKQGVCADDVYFHFEGVCICQPRRMGGVWHLPGVDGSE